MFKHMAGDRALDGARQPVVLQVLPHLDAGGVVRGAIDVAAAQAAAGWTPLVASRGGRGAQELARVGATHMALPLDTKNPLRMRANAARLAHLIRVQGVDLIHARSRAPAWSAWAAARRTNVPLVTTFHGTYGHGTPFKRWYNKVMTRGHVVIAISRHIAAHIEQVYGVAGDRVRVIPRGIDPDMFDAKRIHHERLERLAKAWRLVDGVPVIVLPGRLTRWKGHAVLIEALAKLGRTDICCVLVGDAQGRDGYVAALNRLVAKHHLESVVRIAGPCDDMPAAYMLSDIVVSASTDPEAFGRVPVEAQAMGVPVIVTDHGGARETVIADETGWLVPPGDPNALASALSTVLSLSPARRDAVAYRAVDHVRANFNKTTMCAQTMAVYRELLGRG